MSSWKLVEAEPLQSEKSIDATKVRKGGFSGGSRVRRSTGNRRDSNRGRQYQDQYNGIYIPDTPESRLYYAKLAVYHIESLFGVENLCRDTFFRSYMDEAGYIPIPFACSYIQCFGADYLDIVTLLQESITLEVDTNNETVRLKDGWNMWLMPNGEGGMGLPLYVKQPALENENTSTVDYYGAESSGYYDPNYYEDGGYSWYPQSGESYGSWGEYDESAIQTEHMHQQIHEEGNMMNQCVNNVVEPGDLNAADLAKTELSSQCVAVNVAGIPA